MKDKSLKFKKNHKTHPAREAYFRENHDECFVQFMLWADGTSLDVATDKGYPVFRPAICAWEAWKAAWGLAKVAGN